MVELGGPEGPPLRPMVASTRNGVLVEADLQVRLHLMADSKKTSQGTDEREIGDALGMIETRGLIGMIEAADAMLKTANVVLVSWQKVDAGPVTALIRRAVG